MDVINSQSRGARVGCHGIFHFSAGKGTGFTFLELLITLAVVSLVFSIGVPSLQQLLDSNRASTEINHLVGTLALSRSEAIKRNRRITVCQTADRVHCASSGDWSQGWIGFEDDNKNRQHDENETLLTVGQALAGNTQINFDGAFGIDGYLVYKADGSAFPNGTFTICIDHRPDYGKALILFRTGRLRLSDKTAQNTAISCS
jgi:type IV fimbrial biogenesis protein FimT